MKNQTIEFFFKKRNSQAATSTSPPLNAIESSLIENDSQVSNDEPPNKPPRMVDEVDINSLERDPGKCQEIWSYPISQQDEIRRAYIRTGPYQFVMLDYPFDSKTHRRFQASWFKLFPEWLEYSPSKDAAFCLHCYLFNKPSGHFGSRAFTIEGFRAWTKVNDGENCAFLSHIGKDPNSLHRRAIMQSRDLMNQAQHISNVIEKQTSQQIANNRLILKTSIDAVRWLTFQACSLRGHDESKGSTKPGNFLELVKLFASYNEHVASLVLDNAPQNASYTSHRIQKQILQVFANKIRNVIRDEISESKFCIIIDEARDESKKEQMAIVLRFVDKDGCVKERFFELVHVSDTTSLTLKKEIFNVLFRHNLNVRDIRGQGYDGASNMRGEWAGLQALVSNECPYAYYIHCFAHRLQLALITASREVIPIHQFFTKLTVVVNIVGSSCKRHDQLQASQAAEIERLISIDELETGKGLNQIGTLKRAGDTRWSSHLSSLRSLKIMFQATCSVLKNIISDGATYAQRGDADAAYDGITSFGFVFCLHLMIDIMEITHELCQALQRKSLDIINAMHLVSTTKILIQKLREDGWDLLLEKVKSFCEKHGIDIPDMGAFYTASRGRSRHVKDPITMEHHFRVDVFFAKIDSQLQELNERFKEDVVELLMLCSTLDPENDYKSFNIDDICKLVEKFYPEDFSEQEKLHLRFQLEHFELDIHQHTALQNVSTISELCQQLKKTGKSMIYPLVDKLIKLVLILPVSTATIERAFSAMKIVKSKLRNKMEDDYLGNYMITYIEKEIAQTFDTNSIIDDFSDMQERKLQFKIPQLSK